MLRFGIAILTSVFFLIATSVDAHHVVWSSILFWQNSTCPAWINGSTSYIFSVVMIVLKF